MPSRHYALYIEEACLSVRALTYVRAPDHPPLTAAHAEALMRRLVRIGSYVAYTYESAHQCLSVGRQRGLAPLKPLEIALRAILLPLSHESG